MILFDIGGTHMRAAYSKNGESFEAPQSRETPAAFKDAIAAIESLASSVAKGRRIERAGVSIAGIMKGDNLFWSPNLKGWQGQDIGGSLRKIFPGARIAIVNDADAACLGEAHYGAGRGSDVVAYITVSTGIGGGRVVRGKIDRGSQGTEPGQQVVDFEGMRTLEDLASGTAIKRRFGAPLSEISDKKALDEIANALAAGVYNTILHWSPDAMILGGAVVLENKELFGSVRSRALELLSMLPNPPRIAAAELGDQSGLFGALIAGRER